MSGGQTEGVCGGLSEGKEYEFRVVAVSDAVSFGSSEISEVVITKPRFGIKYSCLKFFSNNVFSFL